MNLAYKRTKKKIDARKEAFTQDRIRRGFERAVTQKFINYFDKVGREAGKALEQNGTQGFDIYLAQTRPSVERILQPHWFEVIKTFATRVDDYLFVKRADNEFFVELLEKFTFRVGANHISDIDSTTRKQLQRVLVSGQKDGLPLPQIAKNIRERFSPKFTRSRSATIARTETHSAASFANHQQGLEYQKLQPNLNKQWVAVNDDRTREAHRIANGQVVAMDEDFIVGGRAMEYTGDPKGGAANVINCRCAIIYIDDETEVFDEQQNVVQPVELQDIPVTGNAKPVSIETLLAPAINNSLRGDSLPIRPVKDIKKEFDERLEAVKSEYTDLRTELTLEGRSYGSRFTGTSKAFKTSLANLDDTTATVVREVFKELDDLAVRFNIPKLNGIYTSKSRKANGSMGDGHLMLNYKSLDTYAASIKGLERKKPQSVIEQEIKWRKEIDDINTQRETLLDEGKAKFNSIRQRYGLSELVDENGKRIPLDFTAYNAWFNSYDKLVKKQNLLLTKLSNSEVKYRASVDTKPVATWKRGDDISERPWSVKEYFEDGIDKTRSLMYHEFGHHVHQITKVKDRKTYLDPPIERKISDLRNRNIDTGASKYSRTEGQEWFAENFALYFMGRKDLTAPDFNQLIKDMMEEANGIR